MFQLPVTFMTIYLFLIVKLEDGDWNGVLLGFFSVNRDQGASSSCLLLEYDYWTTSLSLSLSTSDAKEPLFLAAQPLVVKGPPVHILYRSLPYTKRRLKVLSATNHLYRSLFSYQFCLGECIRIYLQEFSCFSPLASAHHHTVRDQECFPWLWAFKQGTVPCLCKLLWQNVAPRWEHGLSWALPSHPAWINSVPSADPCLKHTAQTFEFESC